MTDADAVLAALRPVLDGLAATFGSNCEVVLHDYRRPEGSVVAVAGEVTGRAPGGAMSELGLSLLKQGRDARDQINYLTRTDAGRVIKASTLLLRDRDGEVFGALCVNVDVTDLRHAAVLLGELAAVTALPDATTTFTNDVGQLIRAVVAEEELKLGRPVSRMTRTERLDLFRALDERGLFALQKAVPEVAAALGISRASAYNHLAQIRS
ncbi:helix-turn-helix transcriptional regulator [Amycolatopsis thermophila]|uniref:Transcriptional regulator YheO n=1 Tax=Amycolatopsis thermophila TaxID=206084 RepID=A0ABU0ESC4_9PSEU|nr:helix-turn-helix transcriptional regulator [Amycolatopsis thermophila]MDQ0378177.1 putative transcriptional regulator YheO [Amycolatopsis thermophila]